MVPFFMLLTKSNEGNDNEGKTSKALRAHCFPGKTNPIDGKQIYEWMNHAASHPLRQNSGNFLSTMREDTVALQTHRPNNRVSKKGPDVVNPT